MTEHYDKELVEGLKRKFATSTHTVQKDNLTTPRSAILHVGGSVVSAHDTKQIHEVGGRIRKTIYMESTGETKVMIERDE